MTGGQSQSGQGDAEEFWELRPANISASPRRRPSMQEVSCSAQTAASSTARPPVLEERSSTRAKFLSPGTVNATERLGQRLTIDDVVITAIAPSRGRNVASGGGHVGPFCQSCALGPAVGQESRSGAARCQLVSHPSPRCGRPGPWQRKAGPSSPEEPADASSRPAGGLVFDLAWTAQPSHVWTSFKDRGFLQGNAVQQFARGTAGRAAWHEL